MTSPSFQIPGEMLEAMKTRPSAEWQRLFEALRFQKSERILACNGAEGLLQLQAEIKCLKELEMFFLSEMRR